MPDLFDSLLKQDIGHLRIIAEFWGLELDSKSADAAREKLTVSLLDPKLLAELTDTLPPEADSAITYLVNVGGRIPWPTFTRKFGDIDRKSTRLNSSHLVISYAVFCLKKKKKT